MLSHHSLQTNPDGHKKGEAQMCASPYELQKRAPITGLY